MTYSQCEHCEAGFPGPLPRHTFNGTTCPGSPSEPTERPARIDYNEDGSARAFVGRDAVNVFAMAAIASALRLYAKTGMQVNRAYTPTKMLKAASAYLGGQKFKARDYLGAADALSAKVQEEKERLATPSTET